jgi:diguanylate cyclase (GGDEF)-like protein/PAS domain S-box-containing protein
LRVLDLAHDINGGLLTGFSRPGIGAAPASAALTAKILRDLIFTPETSRAELAAALQESVRQFESLLSVVSGTFYRSALTPPWLMQFISPGIAAISGYGPDYFVHTPFGRIVIPEDLAKIKTIIAKAVAEKEHFTVCYRIIHRSGQVRWVKERGAAIYDSEGRPQFLEGFISDVTESKELEIRAEASRLEVEKLNAQMSRVLAHTLEGVVAFDHDWNYRFINPAAMEEMGSPSDIIGQNLLHAYPTLTKSTLWPLLRDAMSLGESTQAEFCSEKGDWFDCYAAPDNEGITVFFRNVTRQKKLEQALVGQADDLRSVLDSVPDMVWTSHPDGTAEFYNKAWNDFIGFIPARVEPMSPHPNFIHPDDMERATRTRRAAYANGEPLEMEVRVRNHLGDYRWLLVRTSPQHDENGKLIRWCGAAMDIHERVVAGRKLRESQNLQTSILEASTDCINIVDLDGNLLFLNSAAVREWPVSDAKLFVGQPWTEIWPHQNRAAARRAFRQALTGKVARFAVSHRPPDGDIIWWDVIVSPIQDTDGRISNILCVSRDITEQRTTADRLRFASEQDVLTGIPNRRAFDKHLKKATVEALETGRSVGLLLIDLDHFKHINDTLGHLAGDRLLQAVAKRLHACFKNVGFVARLGGDEFAVVIDGIREESELLAAAALVLSRMEAPITFSGKLINGGLSIGCAMFPRDAPDAQSFLQHTDIALYDLKASGRGGIQMFSPRMMEAAESTANQLRLARAAIRDDALEPYYQPKVRLDTGEIVGLEALLRWWSPGNGIQPPSSVAEAFNDYELSTKIGGQMQRRIFADLSTWLNRGLTMPPVSINAAPAEFLRDDYAERLLDRLEEFGIPPSLVEVEITEHVFLERRSEQIIRALDILKSAGVTIALDDFGTGHSSLSHLRDFPVDVLKIDRSFVSRMLSVPRMHAIVQAISKLGPSLSLDIVAEGVETPEQLHALRDIGCEFGQGFLFGKAMHSAEVGRRLATNNWPFKLVGAA